MVRRLPTSYIIVFKLASMAVTWFEWFERESVPKSLVFTLPANRPSLLWKSVTFSSDVRLSPHLHHRKGNSISYNFRLRPNSHSPMVKNGCKAGLWPNNWSRQRPTLQGHVVDYMGLDVVDYIVIVWLKSNFLYLTRFLYTKTSLFSSFSSLPFPLHYLQARER